MSKSKGKAGPSSNAPAQPPNAPAFTTSIRDQAAPAVPSFIFPDLKFIDGAYIPHNLNMCGLVIIKTIYDYAHDNIKCLDRIMGADIEAVTEAFLPFKRGGRDILLNSPTSNYFNKPNYTAKKKALIPHTPV